MKKKRSAGKIIGSIFLILLLLILLLVAAGFIYVNHFLNKLDRQEITGDMNMPEAEVYEEPTVDATDSVEHIQQAQKEFEEIQKQEIKNQHNIDHILLIGSDRRSTSENGRSDAMILVSLNYDTGNIHLTSLMRAMYVCIPRADGNVWGMLNAAYSWGGPKLLVDTVELNFRIDIDHYVVVDFQSFETAVDRLGGVEIELTEREASAVEYDIKLPLSAGLEELNGAQALSYARIRWLDNDFVRTGRQRKVISALMQKAKNSDIPTLLALAEDILPMVNTNVSNTEILTYITKAFPLLKNPITQRMLPIENESGKTFTGMIYVGGREMYKVDFDSNIKAFHDFIES